MMRAIYRFYENRLYPKLMEMNLTGENFDNQRRELLSKAKGNILEIGFGTGKNAGFYPEHVKHISAIDPNEAMESHLRERLGKNCLEVDIYNMSAEGLAFKDNTFDCVVSTFTLCTITDPQKALSEFHRVLKPGGRFLFLEHGRSPDRMVFWVQNLTNPLFNVFGCGCNVNRNIKAVVENSPLRIREFDSFYLEPKLHGYIYKGIAVKDR
ncbi:MAG: class I SAM-dependent methyltransferase [Clostridia bacterium]|nr:class I SAM-dependent methyltransferase [Clostridia bacterium]